MSPDDGPLAENAVFVNDGARIDDRAFADLDVIP